MAMETDFPKTTAETKFHSTKERSSFAKSVVGAVRIIVFRTSHHESNAVSFMAYTSRTRHGNDRGTTIMD
jgi:hypothetical protein